MIRVALVTALALGCACATDSAGTPSADDDWRPDRIIDVHLHGYGSMEGWHDLPISVAAANLDPEVGDERPPPTPADHLAATLEAMARNGIVLGLVSPGIFEDTTMQALWAAAAEERRVWIGATHVPLLDEGAHAGLEEALRDGRVRYLGELGLVYDGIEPGDPRLEAAFALAERLDVPVGLHTGTSEPRIASRGAPRFRNRFGNPALLEDVLVRHPKLRVWLMHAGYPYLEDTIATLHQYPEVYADISPLNWVLPEAEFRRYVKALVDAGFADRLMFGSDQMRWPGAIDLAVERTARLPFLTRDQKRAIFHDNAARFFRID